MSDGFSQDEKVLPINKDSQINVVVNRSGEGEGEIDLMRVFHNINLRRRVYAWVLVLFVVVGVCGSSG